MCILFISNLQSMKDGYRLIIASNRDEYYKRPTLPANYWSEDQNIIGVKNKPMLWDKTLGSYNIKQLNFAKWKEICKSLHDNFDALSDKQNEFGRDLEPSSVGGTWLALNIRGRLAVLLNVFGFNKLNAKSRGQLVENFVKGDTPASEYMQKLQDVYNGFKLITITMSKLDSEILCFTNVLQNEGSAIEHLNNCVQGFGNGPFIKVAEGEKRFKSIVQKYGHPETKSTLIEELLGLLKWNKLHYPDNELIKRVPKHLGTDNQKQYSSVFVKMPDHQYGTRTHTIILIDCYGNIEYNEWTMTNSDWKHQCFVTKLYCDE